MNGKFYVYEHWRPDRGECFYVGKGTAHRAYQMRYGRNRHHQAIVSKLSRLGLVVEVRIISQGLTNEEACSNEIERIAFWRSKKIDIANMTNGGEGTIGVVVSAETRLKLSAAMKRRMTTEEAKRMCAKKTHFAHSPESKARMRGHKCYLKNHSPEAKEKIRQARLGKKLSPEHAAKARVAGLGYRHTPEMREKNRVLSLGNKHGVGYKHTPEAIRKTSEAAKAMWVKRKAEGWKLSPEAIEKIRAASILSAAKRRMNGTVH